MLIGDNQKKAATVCWTCREERRFGKLVLEGKIEGKRQRGRQRQKYLDGLAFAAGCGAVDNLRRAGERADFKQMVANFRS